MKTGQDKDKCSGTDDSINNQFNNCYLLLEPIFMGRFMDFNYLNLAQKTLRGSEYCGYNTDLLMRLLYGHVKKLRMSCSISVTTVHNVPLFYGYKLQQRSNLYCKITICVVNVIKQRFIFPLIRGNWQLRHSRFLLSLDEYFRSIGWT